MKTTLKIAKNENLTKELETKTPPISPEYFPNHLGINLCSVKSESWKRTKDGQLKEITIKFIPGEKD